MVPRTSSRLAPGFRFHPTDEELVRYYLKRKIFGLPLLKEARDAITDIDIYKTEPWELPGFSKLDSRDLEWYFFSGLDKKYGNGDRTNRATEQGYWKTTGKDRPVSYRCQVVGMKKTLVYHKGRAPKGQRTNWVMHEYRYIDENNEKAGSVQDAFVVCRVFQKSGSGPKNGEQYGAPFVEEEWEENGLEMVPKLEASGQVEAGGDDDFLDENDIEQIFNSGIPTDNTPIPLDYDDVENVTSTDSNSNSQNVSIRGGEYNSLMMQSDDQKFCNLPGHYEVAVGAGEYRYVTELSEDQKSYGLPLECGIYGNYVRNEYIAEPTQTVDPVDDLKFDQSLMNAVDNPDFGHGGFLEAEDLNYPGDALSGVMPEFGDFDPYFDAIDPFDNLDMLINDESPVSGESSLSDKDFNNGSKPAVISDQQLRGNNNIDDASSSNLKSTKDFTSDLQYPFLEQASRMLGSISAPPAFASEFPSKDAALRLYPSSSGAAHVTTGMIEIRDVGSQGTDWLSGKLGRYNIVLSFGMSRGVDNSTTLESVVRIHPGKTASGGSRSWFYLICICVLILSMSVKIGSRVCAM